jgi:predicted MFS family arabinose efflux permease
MPANPPQPQRALSFSSPDYVWTIYRKRWFILLAFFFLNFSQCMATICLSAFMSELASAYELPGAEVNLANSSSALFFLPSFLVATQMYNKMSLRKVLLICSIMIVAGAWMRMLVVFNNQFWWVIAGQTIIGMSSPITTGAVSIIANFWFADNERGRATALMLVSNPLGILTSFLIQAVYGISIAEQSKA